MDIDQLDLVEAEAARSVLDQLLADSRLYHSSQDYRDLLSFVARMRNFAPFNAMLLQIQKPGLSHAASAADWRDRFGRKPKPGARPLLILWPFGPVALVYDVLDTEGRELPKDVASYWAQGPIDDARFAALEPLLWRKHIEMIMIDTGDDEAGSIEVVAPQRRSELTTWPPTARTHGAPCTRTCSSYSALRDPPIPTQVSGWGKLFSTFFSPIMGVRFLERYYLP